MDEGTGERPALGLTALQKREGSSLPMLMLGHGPEDTHVALLSPNGRVCQAVVLSRMREDPGVGNLWSKDQTTPESSWHWKVTWQHGNK